MTTAKAPRKTRLHPSVASAQRDGYGLGRASMVADVAARLELLSDAEAMRYFGTGPEDWAAVKGYVRAIAADQAHKPIADTIVVRSVT